MNKKEAIVLGVILSIFLVSFISAFPTTHHLNLQIKNSSGYITPGTYLFNFTINTNNDCTGTVYSNSTTLTTDVMGYINYTLDDTGDIDYSSDLYFCYYRDNVLKLNKPLSSVPYANFAKNVSSTGISWDANVNASPYNFTIGGLTLNGNFLPGTTLTQDIGSPIFRWGDLFVSDISADDINVYDIIAHDIDVSGDITGPFGNFSSLVVGDVNLSALDEIYLNLSGTNANQNVNISPYALKAGNVVIDDAGSLQFGSLSTSISESATGDMDIKSDGRIDIWTDHEISFRVDGDINDYIVFETNSNQPTITTTGDSNLTIDTTGGFINFVDNNGVTTGNWTANYHCDDGGCFNLTLQNPLWLSTYNATYDGYEDTDTWALNHTFYYNKSEVDNNFSLYVPYTGATDNVDLGDYNLSTRAIYGLPFDFLTGIGGSSRFHIGAGGDITMAGSFDNDDKITTSTSITVRKSRALPYPETIINESGIFVFDGTVAENIMISLLNDGNVSTVASFIGDGSQLNTNSSTWWAGLTGWVSGWFGVTGNELTFNETKLNETISNEGIRLGFSSTYNATYASIIGDNSSWNESYADGLYMDINAITGNSSFNQTLTDTLYAGIEWDYNQTLATYDTYNDIWSSTYNSTYDAKVDRAGDTMTGNLAMSDKNITGIDCVKLTDGGCMCSCGSGCISLQSSC